MENFKNLSIKEKPWKLRTQSSPRVWDMIDRRYKLVWCTIHEKSPQNKTKVNV